MANAELLDSVGAVVDSLVGDSVRPKWRDFTLEDAKAFAAENFQGMGRTKAMKSNSGFYKLCHRNGWLDDVYPLRTRRSWEGFTVEMAQEYYDTNYSGMNQYAVERNDSGFHKMVCDRGWQRDVFPEKERQDWSDMDVDGAKEHYQEHFAGLTRTQVAKLPGNFYDICNDRGWLDEVFPTNIRRSWRWMDTPEKAREYCEEHFEGMIAAEIYSADPGFYSTVTQKGWCREVFVERSHRDWSWMDTPEKAREHYESHFSGMNRSSVQKADAGFYQAVRTRGWKAEVFPPARRPVMTPDEKGLVEMIIEEGL